ncbi:hypothetical protein BGY98DRAFT_944806 [Russula aff. rugulosa BPL654]|nr:hypothetical protein BGY98DRAFT_944806 [Russula aff. rugulosa BPL654]
MAPLAQVLYERGEPGEELGGCKFDRWLIVARGWVHCRPVGRGRGRIRPSPFGRRRSIKMMDGKLAGWDASFFFVVQLAFQGVTKYFVPYCENAFSSSWCIKCSGLMPSSSKSRKLNKLDLWRPHGSERSGIVWHAWKLDVAVDMLMAKEERAVQETG